MNTTGLPTRDQECDMCHRDFSHVTWVQESDSESEYAYCDACLRKYHPNYPDDDEEK